MTDTVPREQVLQAYECWVATQGQDPECFLPLIADDAVMESVLPDTVPHPLAGTRRGIDAVRFYLEAVGREWLVLEFATRETIAEGGRLVWIGDCRWQHKESGQVATSIKVDIWHFQDGKAVRFLEMFDTLAFAQTAALV